MVFDCLRVRRVQARQLKGRHWPCGSCVDMELVDVEAATVRVQQHQLLRSVALLDMVLEDGEEAMVLAQQCRRLRGHSDHNTGS